ncbi:Two-component sensor histidine kinase, contains HisKA and HATPase domains [Filimonas lacunae]|uniref:histidine kinase n=1 Tax=Filimonas lacunae TaxID=477680 RepID=A0A1N7QXD3_9BACT|nr:Two-component sensor histidine kinase, contains HisKA and HATPase domains [Filimonas lacunae]
MDLLLVLGRYYLENPGELPKDLDSALLICRAAARMSVALNYAAGKGKAQLLEANICFEKGQPEQSRQLLHATLVFCREHHLLATEAECNVSLAHLASNARENLDEKMRLYKLAIQLFKEADEKQSEATSLKMLADFSQIKGNHVEALAYLHQAQLIYDSIHFADMQGVYNLFSNIYAQMGNYTLALKYGLMAAKTAEDMQDSSLQVSSIYNHLALTYYQLYQDSSAINTWKKSLQIAQQFKDTGYIGTITCNIAHLYHRMHRYNDAIRMLNSLRNWNFVDLQNRIRVPYIFFNVYESLKQRDKMDFYYKQLLQFHVTIDRDDPNQPNIYKAIIRYLFSTRQYSQMLPYVQELDNITMRSGNNNIRSQNQLEWFRMDSATGNLASALEHYKLYKAYSDSVFNIEKSKQIYNLEVEFETERKDKNIQLLTQKNELQHKTIQKEKLTSQILIGGALLLTLLLLLSFSSYRLKRRVNLQLQNKQEEINTQNQLLKNVLREKEWLLREIHHRVKNNLQIVISLLNTQSAYLNNEDALAAIRNSQHRMHAMSLIHQKLYQSDNMACIDMDWYIRELVTYMRYSFHTDKRIRFTLHSQTIELDVVQAIPLGLILNEAVSNAIKYAFPDNRTGAIHISFEKEEDDYCLLTISDNGVGLPEGFDIHQCQSLGMSLMNGLSEQLGGVFYINNHNGVTITIHFPLNRQLEINGNPATINTML